MQNQKSHTEIIKSEKTFPKVIEFKIGVSKYNTNFQDLF